MALSDDQRALLRLLAQREEGYEDIAALKGLSVEQVRAEVRDALAELQAVNEPPPPPPPPQVVEPPSPPAAQKEEKPEPSPPPAAERKTPVKRSVARKPRPGVSVERRRLLLVTGGALGIVAVVLIAIAVFSGDSGSDSAGANGAATENAAAENGKVTQAVLSPAEGSDASGRAVFGRVGKDEIVLQVTGEDLEPTDKGESYTVWLYRNPKLTLRVGSVPVGEEGNLGARFTIPAELLAYVASGAFNQIYVSRTGNAAYQREVAQAKRNKTLPSYIGETVLTGEITGPIAKQARNEGG